MMATNSTATRWSPVTKLSILAGAVAVPYLLWTAPGSSPPAVARPPVRAAEDVGTGPGLAATAATAPTAEPARRRALPSLQTFAAVVERPLFAPTRRFVRPVDAPEPEPVAEAGEEVLPEPAAAGPGRPDLRFFGTVRQGGKVAALVTGDAGVERLKVGDDVEGWQVTEVTRDRLVLVREGEELAYEIFGKAAATDDDGAGGG